MKKTLLLVCIALIACGDDDVRPLVDSGPTTDAGPGMTDAGPGTDARPGADAGPGTDAGPGMTDAGPGMTDAGPGMTDAGPGTDAGPKTDAGPMTDAGTDAGPMTDAGTDAGPVTDAGTDAGPTLGICDPAALENVAAVAGMVVTTFIDTSMATTMPVALANCGGEPSGQIVVAVTIPGAAADQIVQVSTENAGTADIDTILDFRTDCGTEGVCFDDTEESLRSRGTIMANGGDVVYALISGFEAADEGVIEVSVIVPGGTGDPCDTVICGTGLSCNAANVCEAGAPPVLTAATTIRYDDIPDGGDLVTLLAMGLTGTDADGDVTSFNFTFLDAAGADFDFVGEGEPTFVFALEAADGLASFMEAAFVNGGETTLFPAAAVGFRISLNDATGLESNEIQGTIAAGTFSDAGETCAFTSVCDPATMLVCGATDVCEAPSAPSISAATTLRYDNFPGDPDPLTILAMGITGMDANADVVAYNFTFLDAAGNDIDINMDGMPTFTFALDGATGLATFMEAGFVNGGETALFPAAAVRFRLSVVDSAGLESNEIEGPISTGTYAGAGASCAFTAVCDQAAMLVCNPMDICAAP